MKDVEKADLIVIGAGPYGLATAKTYLQVNPTVNLVILESAASVGGVWAKERLYPGLRLNNLLGTYEYSDFPMASDIFGVEPGQHIPGTITHRYLRAYAEEFGIHSKIRFNSRVITIERNGEQGWLIKYDSGLKANESILTRKLIIATGTFSEPFIPDIKGSESFGIPLFHNKELAAEKETIKKAKTIAILAGSKSGYDTAYMAASFGVEVNWIIRSSGRGATWIAPPYVTPFKKWLEKLVMTRFFTWFSPCSWGSADGFNYVRRLLHGTTLGRWLVDRFWNILGSDVLNLNAYDNNPETKKLEPWTDAFWTASSFSILNYPTDFFQLVRDGKIRVHISDISHLSYGTVNLKNGETVKCDALVCCTGWESFPTIKFLPEDTGPKMGIPHVSTDPDELALQADAEIFTRYPRLQKRPTVNNPYGERDPKTRNDANESGTPTTNNPFRLYRFMIPPGFIGDHSIGFAGMVSNTSPLICAQTQALWLTAYLDDRLPTVQTSSPSFESIVKWDTVLHSQFAKWRYPFGSRNNPDFVFDLLPYVDWLLDDLGLKIHRKHGCLAEWFHPYGPDDYRDLVGEWKAASQRRQ